MFLQNTFAVKKFWEGVFSCGRRKGYIKVKVITLKRVLSYFRTVFVLFKEKQPKFNFLVILKTRLRILSENMPSFKFCTCTSKQWYIPSQSTYKPHFCMFLNILFKVYNLYSFILCMHRFVIYIQWTLNNIKTLLLATLCYDKKCFADNVFTSRLNFEIRNKNKHLLSLFHYFFTSSNKQYLHKKNINLAL